MHDSRSFFSSEQKNSNSLNKDLVLRYFLVFFALSKFSGRIRLPGKPNTLSCNLLFFLSATCIYMFCYRGIGSYSVSCLYIVFTREARVALGYSSSNSCFSRALQTSHFMFFRCRRFWVLHLELFLVHFVDPPSTQSVATSAGKSWIGQMIWWL